MAAPSESVASTGTRSSAAQCQGKLPEQPPHESEPEACPPFPLVDEAGGGARAQPLLLPPPPPEPRMTVAEIASWTLTGMSGWWANNVLYAELPYFVAHLPEQEGLGNLIGVCTQLGNLAPIAYKALQRERHPRHITLAILFFQATAVCTLVAAALFWDTTVAGSSAVLLLLVALSGSVGCMSNVTYWAAANARPPAATRAMSVGMTLGGLLATGFSSLQLAGVADTAPRFSPRVLFCGAAGVQGLMAVAFMAQARKTAQSRPEQQQSFLSELTPQSAGTPVMSDTGGTASRGAECATAAAASGKPPLPPHSRRLLVALFAIYAATYTLPTVQPYMAAGYSDANRKQQLLLAILVLQNAGDVLGRLSTAFVKGTNVVLFSWSVTLVAIFAACIFFAATGGKIKEWLPYGVAILLMPGLIGMFYFSRGLLVTALYLRARTLGDVPSVQRLSLDMGFFGQMGAFLANGVTFLIMRTF